MTAAAAALRGDHDRLKTWAAVAAVAVAVGLIAIKIWGYAVTGSVALLGSLLDSGLDLAASAVNLFAIRHAIAPADHEHRFGHGKAEAIAGLGQAALIAGSSVFLALESASRLLDPPPLQGDAIGIAVMLASMALTVGLVAFQRHVVRRTGSLAIAADRLHYAGDVAMNVGVLAALVLAGTFGLAWADPLIGIAIALLIGYGAWKILRGSFDQLMDREFADADRDRIKALVMGEPEVMGLHDLRTRWSGSNAFIQFHIELDPAMSLERAHRVSDRVEARVAEAFPGAEVLIHQDPLGAERMSARLRS